MLTHLKASYLLIVSMIATLLILGCSEEDADLREESDFSLVGAWNLPGGFVESSPHLINFYANGQYIVYSKCVDVDAPEEGPLEIGTYSHTQTELKIISHIQNGCGGFDNEDATSVPTNPLHLSFSQDGNQATVEDITLSRVIDNQKPIVGSWELPGGFKTNDPHIITFFTNGQYAIYTDCSNQTDPVPNEPLEIGTYAITNSLLTISSHIQNGCGGFDGPESDGPPTDPIPIQFSADSNSFTLIDDGLTVTRIH